MDNNRLKAYRETQIKTATPGKLIIMLYDGAIKNVRNAISLIEEKSKKFDAVNNHIIKAQDIISELMVSLNFEEGGEIAKNLFSLYMYMNKQLLEANLKKDIEPLKEVQRHLSELREAWAQIDSKPAASSVSGGINIAG
ncbi:MAG: flagellar export chaperone FliS [Spirochaetales bacterium]|nr:flagellar export chaperone FliS [Spirochaetales bacterium]